MTNRTFFPSPPVELDGAGILVTGGTGSFGEAFVRKVCAASRPRRLVIFSRDEKKQYEMEQRYPADRHDFIRYFIGDVRDVERLEMAMRGIDIVIHAAALKHVPVAEYNPFECIHTNVMGAENVVRAALRCGGIRVLALSTDKAVNPINLYGASKLAAEKIFVAANALGGDRGCRFSVVRYGNVVGSRGSVVPLFRRLVEEGGDSLPVTDPGMTRFWISLEQGINFVVSSMAMMKGGEIFVPKIPSMRIMDLARAMAPMAEPRIVGIRPGEKLHEVLLTEDEARQTVELDDRYIVLPAFLPEKDFGLDAIGAKPVESRFRYASDTNSEWLTADDLLALLEGGTN